MISSSIPQVALLLLWALALALAAVTVIPVWKTHRWWVRVMDFPRLQIAVLGAAVLVAGLFAPGWARMAIPLAMLAVCGYQLWRIFPYTALAQPELALAPDAPDAIRILSVNVLMENGRHGDLLSIIERHDPDILLLMETDRAWTDAMAPALARYDTVVSEPRSDHYGMLFATRLPVEQARIMHLTGSDTPSIFAELAGHDGTPFRFVGLHPKPPLPGDGTEERDAQIFYAARFARKTHLPLVVTGDFNDVAWSDTSRVFKRVGEYLDPRIGRGFFASFDAKRRWLRFPIDQFYVTEEVAVVAIRRLGFFGSDHFPMAATIRLDADLAGRLNRAPQPISDEERRDIEETVRRTREALGHDEL